jgi:mono/diheme cytochrome c family protein
LQIENWTQFSIFNFQFSVFNSLLSILFVLALAGCQKAVPQFALNMEGRAPESVSRQQAGAIAATLADLFGTPDEPKIPAGISLDPGFLWRAAGPITGVPEGQERGLFRRHCVSCHGVSGDGAGPTAAALAPYPRDFRSGVFKYTSTRGGAKPAPGDLRRTLQRGVAATAMPSFAHLPPEEIDALLEYVQYLSIRGQTEAYLFQTIADDDGPLRPDAAQVVEESALPAAQSWLEPQRRRSELVVDPLPPRPPTSTPPERAACVAKGREIFLSTKSQCVKCHGPEGNGDGQQGDLYDDWNQRKKGDTPEQTAQLARLFTLPVQRLRPRNFHEGIFRGGSTPADLYWRICVGIKGTPMPPAGSAPGIPAVLSDAEIWYVVEFVRSLGGQ